MQTRFRYPRMILFLTAALVFTAFAASAQEPMRLSAERVPGSREIVVASPRASIAWAVPREPEIQPEEAADPAELPVFQVGAAENFAATGISIRVRKDAVVHFRESRQVEGVWYERTYGRLGSVLLVQIQNPSSAAPEWITLGRDGAGAIRRGPSLGTARISVRVQFPRVGEFHLRAVVITGAVPMDIPADDPDAKPVDSRYADFDVDSIPIKVVVVDGTDPGDVEPQALPRGPDLGFAEPLQQLFQE
jgi:hypothetical protein